MLVSADRCSLYGRRVRWGTIVITATVAIGSLVGPAAGATAATCTGRDNRTVTTRTYVPGAGYFFDVKMTRCAAQRMSDTWGTASGSTGVAGTVIGLFNSWTGLALGAVSASQWLTTARLSSCSNSFTSNIVVTVRSGQIIGCKSYSGSVGGGSGTS